MELLGARCAGLDVHAANVVACVRTAVRVVRMATLGPGGDLVVRHRCAIAFAYDCEPCCLDVSHNEAGSKSACYIEHHAIERYG